MLQFPIMTAQEIALDAAFAFAAPHTVLECCFNLFHIRSCRLLICKSFWFSTESENWRNEKELVGVFGRWGNSCFLVALCKAPCLCCASR